MLERISMPGTIIMRFKFILAAVCWLTLAMQLLGQTASTNLSPKFTPVAPLPKLVALAQTNQIPLAGIDLPASRTNLIPGDNLVVLVTLFEPYARRTQWLLDLRVVPPTAREKAAKPPPPMTMTGRGGAKFVYASSPAWVSLRTLGPFVGDEPKRKAPKVLDKQARFILNEGFLGLGLDRAAKSLMWAENVKQNPALAGLTNAPGKKPDLEAVMDSIFTKEDERALLGCGPALMSFVEIVQNTAGLQDILYDLVAKPSVWSVVKNLGVTAGVELRTERIIEINPATWAVPATDAAYTFPIALSLNAKPALNATLITTRPQSPLLPGAGIISVLAERPDTEEHYLTFRILSARLAKAAP